MFQQEAVEERQIAARDFWSSWQRFEEWLLGAQKAADGTRELYSDSMPANIIKIQVESAHSLHSASVC